MELKQKNLTIGDRINNLDGDKRTRLFVLKKTIKEQVPEGIYTKSIYYSYRSAMEEFIKGILSEREQFESLYEETQGSSEIRSIERSHLLGIIEEKVWSLDREFDDSLEKMGNWASLFKNFREKMRTLPNDKRWEMMLNGVDYTVLEIKFQEEEV